MPPRQRGGGEELVGGGGHRREEGGDRRQEEVVCRRGGEEEPTNKKREGAAVPLEVAKTGRDGERWGGNRQVYAVEDAISLFTWFGQKSIHVQIGIDNKN